MTARERVIAAMKCRRPDRIPRYEIFLPGYIDAWRDARGADADADIYDDYAKVDIGQILAVQEGPFTSRISTDETGTDTYYENDSWGRRRRCSHTGTFFEVVEVALPERRTLDSLAFEDPWDDARREQLRR